jgi:DNA-directed RNA polymerase subunit L
MIEAKPNMKATEGSVNQKPYKPILFNFIMEYEVLKNEKNEIEVAIGNLTVAEILRVYLNQDSDVVFAAWKRDHPSKPAVLRVETKGKTAKKALEDAVAKIDKEGEKLVAEVKKA